MGSSAPCNGTLVLIGVSGSMSIDHTAMSRNNTLKFHASSGSFKNTSSSKRYPKTTIAIRFAPALLIGHRCPAECVFDNPFVIPAYFSYFFLF
jgi:hypothetical protein